VAFSERVPGANSASGCMARQQQRRGKYFDSQASIYVRNLYQILKLRRILNIFYPVGELGPT